MADDKVSFPYVVGTQKLTTLIKTIPDIGVPEKFTLKKLKALGYTSSNDERFVPAMKFIGLLDSAGAPTDLWNEARAHLGSAIAKGTKAGYADLFAQFPNAHQKDEEALRTYFTVHSGTGKSAVARMVQTFKAFAELGDFKGASEGNSVDEGPRAYSSSTKTKPSEPAANVKPSTIAPSVAINIQLQVPADPTGEIYDKFFAAMAKHLPMNR